MTSFSFKPQQNQEYVTRNRDINGAAKSNTDSNVEIGLSIDPLHREFHISLDLNYPMFGSTLIELDDLFHPRQGTCDEKIDNRCLMRENKKRCFAEMEMEMDEDGKATNLDLDLKLSPPGLYLEDDSPNRSELLSPSSQYSCMSSDLSPNENNTNKVEISSLILMGCSYCLIYVMVSEEDPKCPNCKSSMLIDIFRGSPAKISRKS